MLLLSLTLLKPLNNIIKYNNVKLVEDTNRLKYTMTKTFRLLKGIGSFFAPCVYWRGGGYYYGSGYTSGKAIAQGDVSLGLVIVLQ